MIPILFAASATAFTSNGIGRLSDARSCVVTEERNGPYTLTLEYPVNGVHFADLKHSNIIVAQPFQGGGLQPFRISRISRPIGGVVKVDAEHISYQLNHIPVMPFSAQGVQNALTAFKTNAAEACPFTFWTDLTSTSSFAIPEPSAIRSYLGGRRGSIIDVYGGGAEYEWDGYAVKLHSARGKDNGVTLRYGKNLLDLEQEENIESTYTGVCPYWMSTEGQLITLPEKVLHSANASNFPYQRTIPYDFTEAFENAPTVAQLREYANKFMTKNNIGVPNVSIDVKFINLADTAEYKDTLKALQTVNLCDTVTVVFEKLGVSTKAKVSKTEWDVLNERYKSITIGDRRSSLSKTIEDQMEKVDEATTASQVQANIDRATGVLGAGLRGHVVINRNADGYANEILFLDTENLYTARNVLRINMNGIGFSSTGYRGPYYQSWTIDGHFALGGNNNSYGDFEILDGSGKKLGEWNKDGLQFFDSAQKMLLKINHGGLYLYNTSGGVLAQLTNKGLDVFDGSIRGGYINIANNFTVDRNGKVNLKSGSININNKFVVNDRGVMKAVDGTFSGKITGGTINIGNGKFVVNENAELRATFTGGNITLGKNFKVTDKGIMTATGATFSGDIKASKITGSTFSGANGLFTVDENGKMKANGAEFSGDITGSKITGSSFESQKKDKAGSPMFQVTDSYFKFLDYYAYDNGAGAEGYYLEKKPGQSGTLGFGDKDGWLLWWNWRFPDASYPNPHDPDDVFLKLGFGIHEDVIFAYDLFLYNERSIFYDPDTERYWSVAECIENLYEDHVYPMERYTIPALTARVAALEQIIGSLGGGGS